MRLIACVVTATALAMGGCASVQTHSACRSWTMGPTGGSGGVLAAIREDLIYPRESCLAGREGTVVARYTLLRNGDVEDVQIQKSSGDPLLDREVVRALESLRARGKKVAWPSSVPDNPRTVGEVSVQFVLN